MKLKFDEKLFRISKYVIVTAILIYISFLCLNNMEVILGKITGTLGYIFLLLKPLVTAVIIAYLIGPLAGFFEKKFNAINIKDKPIPEKVEVVKKEKHKIHKIFIPKNDKKSNRQVIVRILSVFLTFIIIIGVFIAIIIGIYLMIGGQITKNFSLTDIVNSIVDYWNTASLKSFSLTENIKALDIPFLESFKPQLIEIVSEIQDYIMKNIGNMTSSVMTIGSNIANFFISIVISFYLLKDKEYFLNLSKDIYNLFLGKTRLGKGCKGVFLVFHENFSQFIRGQLLEALAVAIMSSIGLALLNVGYALVIGPIAGLMNMIPYVGPVVGTVLACLIALLSGEPLKIISIVIVMTIIQFIDGNLLAPKIIGDSVGLHPVFIMVGIIVGGTLGGFAGMLLAVPVIASLRTLFTNWVDTHQDGIKPNLVIELDKKE